MRIRYWLLIAGLVFTVNLNGKNIEGTIVYENDIVYVTFHLPTKPFSNEIYYQRMQHKLNNYGFEIHRLKE